MLLHTERPNILFIITDQQRHDAVGYIDSMVRTPHLDKLASQSIICTNAFVQSPQCQPSRASILTGKHPIALKMWWNGIALDRRERTIGHYLKEAGYNTAYFGKIHISSTEIEHADVVLKQFGFDTHYTQEQWHANSSKQLRRELSKGMLDPRWIGKVTERAWHHDDVITNSAIQFMDRAEMPYCVMVGFVGPHPPYAAPAEFLSLYADADISAPITSNPTRRGYTLTARDWIELKRNYYASISWIDDNIGKLLTAAGPNTTVVFMSDHGDMLGDHGEFSKNVYAYDGVVRIPLMFRFWQHKPMVYEHLVQALDVLPTLLQASNVGIPPQIQGTDLLPAFEKNVPQHDYINSVIGYWTKLRMIRSLTHKYWLHVGDDTEEVLFDLVNDPGETQNLNDQQTLAKMRLELLRALVKYEDNLPQPVQSRGA